jgi:chaperonin GroES
MSALAKLIPLADRVLIRRVMPTVKTAGGIIIPESAVSKNNEGLVVAVGPGATTKTGEVIPVTVKVGDKVLLPEYGGLPVKVDGEEIFLFRNDEILAKFLK